MAQFLRRYALAIACVAAPFLFGIGASSLTLEWLMLPSHVERIKLDYRLRDQPATPAGVRTGARQKSGPSAEEPSASRDDATPAARFELVAQHFSGLVNFAITSGFLYFVCAFGFALSVLTLIRRAGPQGVALAIGAVAAVTAAETWFVMANKQRRILVTDNIFALADAHDLLKEMPMAERMTELLAANIFAGLFTAGMLIAALAVASVRRGPAVDLADLEDRLFVIRATLILSSALLVVNTLAAKALVDWPISLLDEAQRKALDPAGDAITRLWAGSSSVTLLAAFLPGIAAWYLDRQDFRTAQPPGGADKAGDGLDIAPLSAVTAVLAVLAPVVASPILDAAKSLLTVVGGR
jgi:hypothetical protein